VKRDGAVLLLKGLLTAASLGMTSTGPAAQPTELAFARHRFAPK